MSWTGQPERGSQWLMRFMVRLTLRLGWRAGHALLYPITAYFLLASPRSRAASRHFLGKVLGREATVREQFRHLLTFAATLLDRVFLLTGRTEGYDIRVHGLEHLKARIDAGEGCLLLGAHLGSFEVLRALADRGCPVPVKALMYEANAALVNAVFRDLNPARAAAVIPLGTTESVLRIRECLARGELVGMLGDRITTGDKLVAVDFLGERAMLPVGPMLLATVLKAPVILFFGIRRGSRRYDITFEPFAEPADMATPARRADLSGEVARYAVRLERMCRAHPYNWFNFYDFWGGRDEASTAGGTAANRRPRGGGTVLRPVASGLGGRPRGGHGGPVASP